MHLILVATPKKLQALLEDALSSFSYNAKRLAHNLSTSFSSNVCKEYENLEKKHSNDQDYAATLLNYKVQPLELQQQLKIITEHLELPVPIHYIPLDQSSHLQFDIGDLPTNGSFYVSHPFLENVFIRPAEFNKVLAKEKEAAFVRLAAALGAKTIHLNSVMINQTSHFFGSKIKPSIVAQQIGIKATFDSKGEVIKDIYKQYHKPKREPYVPKELEKWVKLDPALRQLAQDRLDLNLASVKVNLQFKDTHTGGSEIAIALAGRKFEIGGQIQKIHDCTWQFFIEFFDKNDNG